MNNEPFIVDAHTHLGYCSNFCMPDVTPEKMIEIMDICGIKNICTSHIVGLYTHNIEFALEESLEAVRKFPGRIFAYAIYDPFLQKESLRLIEKYITVKGFVGVLVGVGEGVIVGVLVGVGVFEAFASPSWAAINNSGPGKKEFRLNPKAGDTKALVITTNNPRVNIHQWNLIGVRVTDLLTATGLVDAVVDLSRTCFWGSNRACFRIRLTAQCIPCLARWLLGLIDNAFSR